MINKKNIYDYKSINNKLVEISGVSIKLSKSQVSKLKNNVEYMFLDLNQLLEKIKLSIPDFYILKLLIIIMTLK